MNSKRLNADNDPFLQEVMSSRKTPKAILGDVVKDDDDEAMLLTIMGGSSIANAASLWEEEESNNGAVVIVEDPPVEDLLHPKTTTTKDLTNPENDDGNDVESLMHEWKNEEEDEKEDAVSIELVNAITNEVVLLRQAQQHRSRNMALIRSFRRKIMPTSRRSKTINNRRQWKNRLDQTPEEQRRTRSKRNVAVVMNVDEETNLHRLCDDMGTDPQFYHDNQQQRQRRNPRRQMQSRRYKNISSKSLFASFNSSTNNSNGWIRYFLSASCLVGFATLMSIAIMEGLAHTNNTSLRLPNDNNSNNGTTTAATPAVTNEPKLWWEHVNDEKNIIPIGKEGQDWEGGRPNIIQSTTASSSSYIPKVDTNMDIEDIIQPPPHLVSSSTTSNPLHPTWYSIEVGGWSGGTHVDALRFCVVQNVDQQLCPIKQLCPNGPSHPPLIGAHITATKDVGQQWVPVIDAPNTWILIKTKVGESQSSLCMDYTTLVGGGRLSDGYGGGGGPSWGLDESEPGLKRHILCCAETRMSGGSNGDGGG